jgi:hypothetical protein
MARFAAEEEELLRIMGSQGENYDAADGIGEEELLWPEHFAPGGASSSSSPPPVDRLDPSVPHAPEFEFTFQEMMQAEADAEDSRLAFRQRNICKFVLGSQSSLGLVFGWLVF